MPQSNARGEGEALPPDGGRPPEASQQIAEELFNLGPIVIFRWRAIEGWPVDYVSPNIAAQLGYQPEDFLSGRVIYTNIIHPDDLKRVIAEVDEYSRAGAPAYDQEYRIALANRDYRWIFDHTVVGRDAQGQITHYLGYILDITSRKQAEEALRASEEQYRTLINTSPDGIILTDATGKILMASSQSLAMFRIDDPTVVIGRNITDFVIPEDTPRAQDRLQALRTEETSSMGEYTGIRMDGSQFIFEAKAQVIRDSLGRVSRMVFTNRDISNHKQSAAVLAKRAQELTALYETALDITSHLELPTLLEAIVRRAAGLLDSQIGALYLLQPETQTLELVVSHHLPESYIGTRLELGEGLAGRIAQSGETMMVGDYTAWEGRAKAFEDSAIRRMLGAPLKVKGQVIGVICVGDDQTAGNYTPEEINLVSLFADQAAIAVENARLYARVDRLAIIDELTGIFNRRGLFNIGTREVDRAMRFNRPLSALFLDIDHFKAFNDRYSHDVGDLVLRAVAVCCQETLRKVDVVARYGGDEFTILLMESRRQDALEAAERLRKAIETLRVPTPRGPLSVTISIGVAELSTAHPDLESLIHRADQAMYAAKEAGGNCMVIGAE